MVPSCIVLDYRRTYSLKNSGGTIVVIIEILEISPKKIGIFQDKYKMSWVAFSALDAEKRVLSTIRDVFAGVRLTK